MDMEPFVVSAKLPSETNAKLPKSAGFTVGETAASLTKLRLSAVERRRRLEEAKAFLRQHLAGGPQPACALFKAAKLAGIAERTLHRAKDLLGVTTERVGGYAGRGQWIWYPSADTTASAADVGGRQTAVTSQRH
jgi:hypothetical protein